MRSQVRSHRLWAWDPRAERVGDRTSITTPGSGTHETAVRAPEAELVAYLGSAQETRAVR